MEQRDLYDNNKNVTGLKIYKDDKIPTGMRILVVVVILQNSLGQFLIQKRSQIKDGKWALTGGHPKSGETSLEGIKTEVKEELGIDIDKPILFKTVKDDDSYCDLYYLKKDIKLKDLVLQETEVSDAKYASEEEIEDLFNKGIFKKSHYMMFKDCLEYLSKRKER